MSCDRIAPLSMDRAAPSNPGGVGRSGSGDQGIQGSRDPGRDRYEILHGGNPPNVINWFITPSNYRIL